MDEHCIYTLTRLRSRQACLSWECYVASVARPSRPSLGAVPESPVWGDQGAQGLPMSCLALEIGLAQSLLISGKASSSWVLWPARSPGAREERGLAGWAGPHRGAVSPEATSKAAPAIRVHFPQLRAFPVLSASPLLRLPRPPRQPGLPEPGDLRFVVGSPRSARA